MTLHEKIGWARRERKWVMAQLSGMTGITLERLSEIEAGKPVKMSELVKIAEALKRDVSFFLTDDDPIAELFLWCKDS